MAETRQRKSKWLKETSTQSGFDNFRYDGTTWHKKWVGAKQTASKLTVAPDELDIPPPSSIPLGGAGISGSPRANSLTTDIPTVSTPVIQYITAAGGISMSTQPWIMVIGSNDVIDISANPQVAFGDSGQIIAIQCVGSGVTLEDGDGLALAGNQPFAMTSGSIINLVFNNGDNLLYETSRVKNGGI